MNDPYAKLLTEVRRRQALHDLRRRILLVLAGIAVGVCAAFLLSPTANAQSRPVGDPAAVRTTDVRPIIARELGAYLDGGESGVWNQHRVTAAKLTADYVANEVAADRRYNTGPDVVVTGTVRRVSITMRTPTVSLDPMLSAFMLPGHDAWVAELAKGDRVMLVCRNAKQTIGMVSLHECVPRDAYIKAMADTYFQSLYSMAKTGNRDAQRLYRMAGGSL